ncbi:hypothetical protein PTTG_26507 [Puccinia triticina 1-1 BBBD Race 1]|uniref:Uncharacterized protein n=1 Tax=Puccinia triticina (isolate 1-1 / race 1 (BBBD)) TaxID=630390 RepID=A0A180GTP1_PUCT1|nr:hypothetical protein PTTG_26507 [Puccinia triticina 1-1 BBBD Race 1]
MAGSCSNPAPAAPAATPAPISDNRDTFKCPNFTGKNFLIWQRKVKTYLAVKSHTKCIKQPLPPNASEEHIEDHIYNNMITNENQNDAFAIWKELKGEYASSSVLAIYHVWRKWEEIQYKEDINSYVTKLKETLAEFAAMGLDIPPTILSCTIIA